MLFSVIIPVYNSEKFIRRCINSILEQTYQEFEVIVIDDGSTDSTSKILENFSEKDTRIKVYNFDNSGVTKARQRGVLLAKGDYICMEKIDKYWDEIHLKYTSNYDGWLDKYMNLFKKDNLIIELGCGRAYSSKYILNNGFNNIVACDFSQEVLKVLNKEVPNLKTMLFDMSRGLPFRDNSVNIIIADLSLHYFDKATTKFIFEDIYRVLKKDGYLIARVNSTNDINHIPKNSQKIEENFYFDGKIYKKFFKKEDFELLFTNYEAYNLEQKTMNRYEKNKIIWEFCIKK